MKHILTALLSIMCISCYAASYSTKSSTTPGNSFSESSSWNSSSMPGTYTSGTFTAYQGSSITINGYVGLGGSLYMTSDALLSGSSMTIAKNSIVVIDGDLHVSDRVDITVEEGGALYITGSIVTYDKSDTYKYVNFDVKKNANVVVEGDVKSTGGANVAIFFENGNNSDFYVFGNQQGTVYRKTGILNYKKDGSSFVDNEETFNSNESTLVETVNNIITEVIDGCEVISIPAGGTVIISGRREVCGVTFGSVSSKLIIETDGELVLKDDIEFSKGIITNYGAIMSDYDVCAYPSEGNGSAICRFVNNGLIKCKNFYMGSRDVLADTRYISFTCGSSVVAENSISFTIQGWAGDLELLGNYKAQSMTIEYQNGGNSVNFGKDCGDSRVELNNLTLKSNISQININEITGLEKLTLDTYSSVKMSVTGEIIIGDVVSTHSQTLGMDGGAGSIITLCYNPTHGADFGGNGQQSSTSGVLVYRYDESDISGNTWYNNGITPSNPETENDIKCLSCKMKANNVGFDECMDGETIILGIDESEIMKKEIHFRKRCSVCSDEYAGGKVIIEGLVLRNINGTLIYCRADN